MGKTFKRNSYRKPKSHGKTFEKKNKSNKKLKHQDINLDDVIHNNTDKYDEFYE